MESWLFYRLSLWLAYMLYAKIVINKRATLQNKQVWVLRMAFRAQKVFGTIDKRAPGPSFSSNS